MKRTIKSYFSEADNESDGIYIVDIPLAHENDYKSFIHEIGHLLDYPNENCFCRIRSANDLMESYENDYPRDTVGKDILLKHADRILELADEGSTLDRTLKFICEIESGWSYEEICIDDYYDADYTQFN